MEDLSGLFGFVAMAVVAGLAYVVFHNPESPATERDPFDGPPPMDHYSNALVDPEDLRSIWQNDSSSDSK